MLFHARHVTALTLVGLLLAPVPASAYELDVKVKKELVWCDQTKGVHAHAGVGHTPYLDIRSTAKETPHFPSNADDCSVNELVNENRLRLRGTLQKKIGSSHGASWWKTCRKYPTYYNGNKWLYNKVDAHQLRYVHNPKKPICGDGYYRLKSWHGRKYKDEWHGGGQGLVTGQHWWD